MYAAQSDIVLSYTIASLGMFTDCCTTYTAREPATILLNRRTPTMFGTRSGGSRQPD
jgi:hypothetical protein